MIHRKSKRNASGFTFPEILMTLMLLGAFSLVASLLFQTVFGVYRSTENIQTRISRYESATLQMRLDVWSAEKIMVPSPQSAELDSPSGKITWRIDESGAMIRRDNAEHETRWEEAGKTFSFAADSAGLLINEPGEDPATATRFISQVMSGGRR